MLNIGLFIIVGCFFLFSRQNILNNYEMNQNVIKNLKKNYWKLLMNMHKKYQQLKHILRNYQNKLVLLKNNGNF